ncbi:hypothetical protein VTN96DRAFT_8528 [Rasamsonia emersonii]
MMLSFLQSPQDPYISVGLNNLVAKETHVEHQWPPFKEIIWIPQQSQGDIRFMRDQIVPRELQRPGILFRTLCSHLLPNLAFCFRKIPRLDKESSKNSDDLRGTTNKQSETELEKPPAVPPKSPRMMGRSPSVSQRGVASKYTSPARKAPSSIDKNSTVRNASTDTGSPNTTHVATQLRNPLTRPRAATAMDFRPSEGPSSRVHQRSESASAAAGSASETSERFLARNTHKKELSETSIMDRGRPTKRRNPSKDRTIKELPSAEYIAAKPLPSGVIPSEAASVFSIADLERLQDQARGQAEKFEVLKYRDVKALSQELRALDERCEYLRNTHRSLRSGRQTLHERMIAYLRSPTLAKFSCESMLRQQEALAELDQSIDEWITKLEHFENRRTRVRQKLLEHVAAALMLQTTPQSQASEQQTPPRSPVNNEENGVDMSRQESIKIYADSKVYADASVHALFAEIEKEMERMNESRNAPSSQESQAAA